MTVADVHRVAIVDDQPQSRKTYGYTVSNAELDPVPIDGPLGSLDDYLRQDIEAIADAALCDYRLNLKAYAGFTGAELVAGWYKRRFPALLCTRWEKTQVDAIRPLRRWIPVLLKPNDLNEETLSEGLETCIRELGGNFTAKRRPWRTQVHFLQADEEHADIYYAEIPAWDLREVIRVRIRDLPAGLADRVTQGFRCHARANLGASEAEDLYLFDWDVS